MAAVRTFIEAISFRVLEELGLLPRVTRIYADNVRKCQAETSLKRTRT